MSDKVFNRIFNYIMFGLIHKSTDITSLYYDKTFQQSKTAPIFTRAKSRANGSKALQKVAVIVLISRSRSMVQITSHDITRVSYNDDLQSHEQTSNIATAVCGAIVAQYGGRCFIKYFYFNPNPKELTSRLIKHQFLPLQ